MIVLLAGQAGAGKSAVEQLIRDQRPAITLGMADPLKQFAADVLHFSHDQLYGPSSSRNALDPRWSSESFWSDSYFRLREFYSGPFVKSLEAANLSGLTEGSCWNKLTNWILSERDHAYKTRTLTARRILQTLGTEYGRETFGADVWIKLAIAELNTRGKHDDLKVITDGRFPNELQAVKAAGGKVWHVTGGASRPIAADAHESERGLMGLDPSCFDFVIKNPVPMPGGDTLKILRVCVSQALASLKGEP